MTRKEEIENVASEYAEEHPMHHSTKSSFVAGAKWADKTMLEKAIKWLEENAGSYLLYPFCEYDKGALLEDFKKYMED